MKKLKFILESREYFSVEEVNWQEIKFVTTGKEHNLMYLGVVLPGNMEPTEGLEVTVQVVMDALYQPHISLPEDLRGKGLAAKIYRALVERLGHLYSGKGRRQNPMVDRVWAKLKMDTTIRCAENSIGTACWLPDDELGDALEEFLGEE
jgi:hypothetical protein